MLTKITNIIDEISNNNNKSLDIPKDLLIKNLHPITFYIYMKNEYENYWVDFEPEVVRYIFKDYEDIQDELISIHGAWSMIISYGEDVDLNFIEKCVLAFVNKKISFNWKQDISLSDMVNFLFSINSVLPMEYDINTKNFYKTFFEFNDFKVLKRNVNYFLKDVVDNTWFIENKIPPNTIYSILNESSDYVIEIILRIVNNFINEVAKLNDKQF